MSFPEEESPDMRFSIMENTIFLGVINIRYSDFGLFDIFLPTGGQMLAPGIEPLTVQSLRSNSQPVTMLLGYEGSKYL